MPPGVERPKLPRPLHGTSNATPRSPVSEPERLRSDGQGLLRRAATDLLRVLDGVAGPDEPETRETLRDLIAAVEERMKYQPAG